MSENALKPQKKAEKLLNNKRKLKEKLEYQEKIEESARLNLLDRVDWDTYEFEFKIKDLLRASITTRIANNKARIESGQSTINEVRIEEGYAPIEGGDNLMLASNLITLDRVVTGQTGQGE